MKGCAFRALLSLLALVTFVAGVGAGLNRQYGVALTDAMGVSIGAGFLAWVTLNLLLAAVKAWRERIALASGIAGTPPVDGRTILVGYIEPVGPVLRAPLSNRECVAYTFEVYEYQGTHRRQTKVVYCDGIALTPSAVVTASGTYRLLAVPELDCAETALDREAVLGRVADLMRTLPLQPPAPSFSRPSIEQQWNDDDGEYRRERRCLEGPVDRMKARFTERQIERGARVCVFGPFSAAKRAVVADPNDWSKTVRIQKGDPDAVVRQLGSSVIRRLIIAVICAAASAGLVAAFIANLR